MPNTLIPEAKNVQECEREAEGEMNQWEVGFGKNIEGQLDNIGPYSSLSESRV